MNCEKEVEFQLKFQYYNPIKVSFNPVNLKSMEMTIKLKDDQNDVICPINARLTNEDAGMRVIFYCKHIMINYA